MLLLTFTLAIPRRSWSCVGFGWRDREGLDVGFDWTVKNEPGSTPRAFFLSCSIWSVSEDEEDEGVSGCRTGRTGENDGKDSSLSDTRTGLVVREGGGFVVREGGTLLIGVIVCRGEGNCGVTSLRNPGDNGGGRNPSSSSEEGNSNIEF